jgi:heptosyltransferase-2
MTTVVFAPNWLGDVVMALPAIGDIRRHPGTGRLVVAARSSVAGVFDLVPGIDRVVTLARGGGLSAFRAFQSNVRTIAELGAGVAILLPNSMHVAAIAARAGVPERWGYSRDLRRFLLTRRIARPKGTLHQADYYRHLVTSLGMERGASEFPLLAPPALQQSARDLLVENGWNGTDRLVGMAPGAAYGSAKQWPPDCFARLAAGLTLSHGARSVLLGSGADARVTRGIAREANTISRRLESGRAAPGAGGGALAATPGHGSPAAIDLAGRTTLQQMVGVLTHCRAFVSNDSGAMHVAAAAGLPVVAMFGPTEEHATSPLIGSPAVHHALLTSPTWCRPCMLRECPLDHACMTGISPERVHDEVVKWL